MRFRSRASSWVLAVLLAACGEARAPSGPSLEGTWICNGIDFGVTLSLAGPPNALVGDATFTGQIGSPPQEVLGDQRQLLFTANGVSSSYNVFFLAPNAVFLEQDYSIPVTGTCDGITYQYAQCTGKCLPADAGGDPAGFCFVRG